MKCHLCVNYIELQTDPGNCDYVIVSGARRKEERWEPGDSGQVLPDDRRGSLEVLNQRLLPGQLRYERVGGVERAWGAIRDMEVRGAPAIALLGCLSLAVELARGEGPAEDLGALEEFVAQKLGFLLSARPTAANLGREAERLRAFIRQQMETPGVTPRQLRER
ncbi:methylthioribose-1-phosphate isomerase-like [Malurus melanocephalus]|uniref:methylthioribose-1-phosphate isomerase-like n=1 Tax=Malurus melanocephalus TaxID=175006 RepID=UPI002547799E|nr:methylthioribose-1-phosphate isomerase-like [Malurus melanocephalus]